MIPLELMISRVNEKIRRPFHLPLQELQTVADSPTAILARGYLPSNKHQRPFSQLYTAASALGAPRIAVSW